MIDFEVKQPSIGVRLRFLAKNKTMKSKGKLVSTFTSFNGVTGETITREVYERPEPNMVIDNLSPRMAKARKLRKQLKKS